MSFLVAANVIASRAPERRPTFYTKYQELENPSIVILASSVKKGLQRLLMVQSHIVFKIELTKLSVQPSLMSIGQLVH